MNGCFLLYSPQTVGVIVRIERETFSILNQHGKVRLGFTLER